MKFLIFLSILFSSMNTHAEQNSMRRCMILPISDTAGNSFGFKVYEDLEKYIKTTKWCDYASSSGVIEIFSKYRDKLPEFLSDPKVLRTVSDRLRVGTIIRVGLKYDVDKLKLSLDVIGENGSDIYFSEKIILNKIDAYETNTTLVNWLDLYETTIPYHGKVVGVLGDQITFSFAKNKRVAIGQAYRLKRFLKKKRHPLLKKVVEWETEVIAKGKVFNLSRGQALGIIKIYTSNKKVSSGDWVYLEKYDPRKDMNNKNFTKFEEHKFGRLGDFSIAFSTSSSSASTTASSGNNKMDGIIYGISGEVETWITRNYFVTGEFSRKVGTLSKTSGSPASSTTGQSAGVLKIAGGYKYLPMGFFYGPQINLYTGWVNYTYQLDTSAVDGFGTNSISGFLLGVGGNIPLKKGIRIYGSGEILPFGDFEEDDNIFGSTKSISSLVLEIGASYQWSSTVKILGGFEITNNSVKMSGSNSALKYNDTSLKLGGLFGF